MTTPWFSASPLLIVLFSVVVAGTAAALLFGLRRFGAPRKALSGFGLGLALFSTLALALAQAELLVSFSLPPRPLVLFWVGFFLLVVAFRTKGLRETLARVPLGALILFQAFRLPLELVMQLAADEKVMPRVMSLSGRNFDVVTGVLSLVVGLGLLREKLPRSAAWVWNLVGLGLLVNVVLLAVFSAPTPLRRFPDDVANLWVAYPPFVLLPAVLVPFAAFGHLVVGQRLLAEAIPDDGLD